jgi:hypothetical protein
VLVATTVVAATLDETVVVGALVVVGAGVETAVSDSVVTTVVGDGSLLLPLCTATAMKTMMSVSAAAAATSFKNRRTPQPLDFPDVLAGSTFWTITGGTTSPVSVTMTPGALTALLASASIIVPVASESGQPGSDSSSTCSAVGSTVRVGLGDELVGRGLWCVGGECDRRDLVVVDLVDQSIAAQDEPVAVHHRHQPRVDAHRRLDAERPRDDVAARMASRLVLGDVAGVDQFLHVAVIDGRPMELAVAQ